MNLTLTDKAEIKRIISGLGDADMEHVKAETVRLAESCAALFDMLEEYKPDEFTKVAVNWLREDDCNAQDNAAKLFYDALFMRIRTEYAINVLMGRQRMEDAA